MSRDPDSHAQKAYFVVPLPNVNERCRKKTTSGTDSERLTYRDGESKIAPSLSLIPSRFLS